MSIEVDEVKKIAKLAALDVKDADLESYATNLSNILNLVAQMNALRRCHIRLRWYSVCAKT